MNGTEIEEEGGRRTRSVGGCHAKFTKEVRICVSWRSSILADLPLQFAQHVQQGGRGVHR